MTKSKETQNSPEKIVKRGKGKSIPPKGGMTNVPIIALEEKPAKEDIILATSKDNPELVEILASHPLKGVFTKKQPRKGYVIAVAHNRDIVMLRSPKGEELSRRLVWKFPANFQSTIEVGQVYEVNASVTNRRDMDFLLSTIEVISVVGLIPTE